jgi:tripartite-type tricarboxylate transporter receptor subunit TctC
MRAFLRHSIAAWIALLAFCASAQPYPSRPVTLVLGFSPGGISDGIVRQISEFARDSRGANVVIDYKPGAASTIATALIKRSAADGYMVSLMSPSAMFTVPNLQPVPYDPNKDFTHLGLVMAQPQPMYVLAASPFNSFQDVVAFAKANPGKFSWGTAGANGLAQILVQSAFAREKAQTTNIPFKGGADAIGALLGGHIDAVVSTDFGPQLAANKVRLIVETGQKKAVPTISTFKELGYPLSVTVQYGVFGPAGMPAEAVKWWDELLRDLAASAKYAEFAQRYYGFPIYSSPQETTQEVMRSHAEIGRAIKALGLKAE